MNVIVSAPHHRMVLARTGPAFVANTGWIVSKKRSDDCRGHSAPFQQTNRESLILSKAGTFDSVHDWAVVLRSGRRQIFLHFILHLATCCTEATKVA